MSLYQKLNDWITPKPRPRLRVVTDEGPYTPHIPLLAEITRLTEEITQEDVARAERVMDEKIKKEDKVLGTIYTEETRRTLALSVKLRGKRELCLHRALYECIDAALAAELKAEAERWSDIGRLANGIFWIQAKDDIGEPAWSADAEGQKIELRSGWVVVIAEPKPSGFEAIRAHFERPSGE